MAHPIFPQQQTTRLQTRFIGVGDFRFLLSRDVFWMFVQQTIVFASGAFSVIHL